VTEQGAGHLGEVVRLTVTSVLQTKAGRMIFGRHDPTGAGAGSPRGAGAPGSHENLGRPGREA
jgi:hypothetical protein